MLSWLALNWTWTCIDMCLIHKSSAPVQWSTRLSITLHLTACQAFINYTCCFPVCLWRVHSRPQSHSCQWRRAQAAGWTEDSSAELLLLKESSQTHLFLPCPPWKAAGNLQYGWTNNVELDKKMIRLRLLRKSPGKRQEHNLVTWISVHHLRHWPSLEKGLVFQHQLLFVWSCLVSNTWITSPSRWLHG